MRSLAVKIPNSHGAYSFEYNNLLVQVAKARFPEIVIESNDHREAEIEFMEELEIDCLEDLFRLRFLSIDLQRREAIVLYQDQEGWCFEHRRYWNELSHDALHYQKEGG